MNNFARSITKWTKACDKRLNRLISHIHHTCETNSIVMWVILQSNAGWDCFKTPILREILRTQNLLRVEHCVFGSHTSVPISWMGKKQTSVSHSSTESEIISLDAGLRMDGIPALDATDHEHTPVHSTIHNTSWRSDGSPPCLGESSHGWVPVNTHSTPVFPKGRMLWVAH